jgi:hypothetical protein
VDLAWDYDGKTQHTTVVRQMQGCPRDYRKHTGDRIRARRPHARTRIQERALGGVGLGESGRAAWLTKYACAGEEGVAVEKGSVLFDNGGGC